MALFTEERLKNRVRNQIVKGFGSYVYENLDSKASAILNESISEQKLFSNTDKTYDIFLSHSSEDKKLITGLKLELEDIGYTVYIDWVDDPKLDRTHVTKTTAHLLQKRMKQSRSLIYAFSENASNSRWMPWELGYFDGIKGTVAVLPITKTAKNNFQGSEYLDIYNYIQIDQASGSNKVDLWVHEKTSKYVIYNAWLTGAKPIQR